jgi:hypothetical protein
MPKLKKELALTGGDLCRGGRSYGCKKIIGDIETEGPTLGPHKKVGGGYYCRFCDEYMGCKLCAQNPSELVCMCCHDWALNAGEKKHGRMVRDRTLGAEALRITRMIYRGSLTQEDGEKLMSELFRHEKAQAP